MFEITFKSNDEDKELMDRVSGKVFNLLLEELHLYRGADHPTLSLEDPSKDDFHGYDEAEDIVITRYWASERGGRHKWWGNRNVIYTPKAYSAHEE